MWGRYPHIDTSPHIVDPDVITTTTTTTTTTDRLQPLYHLTTLFIALYLHHGKQLAQLTSTAAPDITTATGRTFNNENPSKSRFLNDRVRASACSLAS
jgi:hypothetical protein